MIVILKEIDSFTITVHGSQYLVVPNVGRKSIDPCLIRKLRLMLVDEFFDWYNIHHFDEFHDASKILLVEMED